MKKYLLFAVSALLIGFTACSSDDPSDSDISAGGTKVKKMAGDWVATVYYADGQTGDNSEAYLESLDWQELGSFGGYLYTYNTAANKSTEMWLDDEGECNLGTDTVRGIYANYSHKVKVNVRYGKRTFSVADGDNEYGTGVVTVVGGKVIKNGSTIVFDDRGQTTKRDSIVYYVYVAGKSYGYLKVSGYRNDR